MIESGSNRYVSVDHPNGMSNMMDEINGRVLTEDNPVEKPSHLPRASSHFENPLETVLQNDLLSSDKAKQTFHHPCRSSSSSLFSAKELSCSIIGSERTRVICSALIALLVVLSYIDYPLLGINIVNSKSIVAARPLYILLVTEITILVSHLVFERQRRRFLGEFEEEDEKVVKEGGVNWGKAVRVLERGLVAHQTVRALFIDCSVYVVIVVCGLCLV